MVETTQFKLPLVDASQAQKHVTVNEALARLDTAAQLRLVSTNVTAPPVTASDGVAYYVPTGAVNAWDGRIGEVAIFANGGWVFMTPKVGWRAWIEDIGLSGTFDGIGWRENVSAMTIGGASTNIKVVEFDHVITAGANNSTSVVIEDSMLVHGVTGRVLSDITGVGLNDWKVGIEGTPSKFASGIGLLAGTWFRGLTSKPQVYWGGEPIKLSATGGDFATGSVRLVIHGITLDPPW
jgi:uncharacterized protein DUF2793